MFTHQDGQAVLFLNGSPGTFAETPAFPVRSENLTISVWIKILAHSHQPVYGDWSAPFSFRLFVENGTFHFDVTDSNEVYLDILTPTASSK